MACGAATKAMQGKHGEFRAQSADYWLRYGSLNATAYTLMAAFLAYNDTDLLTANVCACRYAKAFACSAWSSSQYQEPGFQACTTVSVQLVVSNCMMPKPLTYDVQMWRTTFCGSSPVNSASRMTSGPPCQST